MGRFKNKGMGKTRGGRKRLHKDKGYKPAKKTYSEFIHSMMAIRKVNDSQGQFQDAESWDNFLCGKNAL